MLRGTCTRFATWFYAMMRLLRLKDQLLTTIHEKSVGELDLNARARYAIIDIMDDVFWRALYALVCTIYPAIYVLRYCESNTPAMDEVYHLAHRTSIAIQKSTKDLNATVIFIPLVIMDVLQMEENEVYGEVVAGDT